ncbi:pyroglutamyl-peptidase I [Piscinibacter sakaiensis]|uniref:pyroglutamyl-peptidase I n=1 Tax=Piscinibacter sakaiensis TaxID=1547922 RepID=UPI003AAB8E20
MRGETVLLTGFEPFGGDRRNPSIELARSFDGDEIAGLRIVARQLPCRFADAGEQLAAAVDALQPRLVLAMGLAAGRAELSFERVAINLVDARIADNGGAQPVDEPVCGDGPAAYFSTLPIKRMVAAVRRAGIAASVSHSAGTFVCNQVFYLLQHHLQRAAPAVPGGFLHLPLLAEQAAERLAAGVAELPAMRFDEMQCGLRAALVEALEPADRVAATEMPSEGTLH